MSFESIDALEVALGEQSYLPDRGLATMAWALGVAASFMLAAAFAALWYATRTDLGATRANVAQLEGMLHDRDRALQAKEAELAWLKDPRVQVALLKGLESNPSAKARLPVITALRLTAGKQYFGDYWIIRLRG